MMASPESVCPRRLSLAPCVSLASHDRARVLPLSLLDIINPERNYNGSWRFSRPWLARTRSERGLSVVAQAFDHSPVEIERRRHRTTDRRRTPKTAALVKMAPTRLGTTRE